VGQWPVRLKTPRGCNGHLTSSRDCDFTPVLTVVASNDSVLLNVGILATVCISPAREVRHSPGLYTAAVTLWRGRIFDGLLIQAKHESINFCDSRRPASRSSMKEAASVLIKYTST
jgi:hypothetical protein